MKKIIIFLLLAVCLSGCAYRPDSDSVLSFQPPTAESIVVDPEDTQAERSRVKAVLYFPSGDLPYLTAYPVLIDQHQGEWLEQLILQALIAGPPEEDLHLTPVFPANTQIIEVSGAAGTLNVTFSRDFLDPPGGAPMNWEEQEEWRKVVYQQRQLALISAANALTEQGLYTRIQFLLPPDRYTREGQRMTYREAGIDMPPAERDKPMDPMARQPQWVLTPSRTVELMLETFSRQDWDGLYTYLSLQAVELPRPDEPAFRDEMIARELTLTFYELTGITVSPDGQSAVALVNIVLRDHSGAVHQRNQIPLPMVQERYLWRISYQTLYNVFLI